MSTELARVNGGVHPPAVLSQMSSFREKVRGLYISGMSCVEVAAEIGVSKRTVLRWLEAMGIPRRPLREAFRMSSSHGMSLRKKGADALAWRGGRKIAARGYMAVLVKEHPNADPDGYVLEHRLVMEKSLGRYLEPNEHVHHLNGIKTDNRLENLELLTQSEHMSRHAKSRPRSKRGTFTNEQ